MPRSTIIREPIRDRRPGPTPAAARRSSRTRGAVVSDDNSDIDALSFEKAIQELEEIVGKLEKASVSLDDSVKLYARGEALKKRCDALLGEAEARIEKITLGADGRPKGVAPLDVE
jgi:exodeoxyribonuclease VII small subunit